MGEKGGRRASIGVFPSIDQHHPDMVGYDITQNIDCVLVFGELSNVKLVFVHYKHWHMGIKLNVQVRRTIALKVKFHTLCLYILCVKLQCEINLACQDQHPPAPCSGQLANPDLHMSGYSVKNDRWSN